MIAIRLKRMNFQMSNAGKVWSIAVSTTGIYIPTSKYLHAVIVLQSVTIIYITIFYVTSLPDSQPPLLATPKPERSRTTAIARSRRDAPRCLVCPPSDPLAPLVLFRLAPRPTLVSPRARPCSAPPSSASLPVPRWSRLALVPVPCRPRLLQFRLRII